ncbi:MAG TPA: integrase [Clostridiales bacterium]|nr:MAG: integrase [Clostridiales bacterium GWD2_32_59]HAN09838.1 integrase [Clostridiales bacterium]
MDKNSYQIQQKLKFTAKLRELTNILPSFCFDFFRGIEQTTGVKTRIAYAYDLIVFFDFLFKELYINEDKTKITVDFLDKITPEDIERYLEYLSYFTKKDERTEKVIEHANDEKAKARKLASLRTFYKYFYKKRKIKNNPSLLVDLPKIHQKNIIRLEVDEMVKLLDEVESGNDLTKFQQKYHSKTKIRDLALISLLLGTGIRVSECVGLDINDIDMNTNGIKITRKGGNEVIVYFSDEVKRALIDYLQERNSMVPESGHEKAFLLSLQNKRLNVRSVQNIVKKYSALVTNLKKISPHKLRSTYGTNLYRETGDIYLVADVLGHKDVNTTKKHYAQIDDERRRKAAKIVKLREI